MKTNSQKVAEIIITHISMLSDKGYVSMFDNGREQGYTIHNDVYSCSVAENRSSDQIVVYRNGDKPFGESSIADYFNFGDYAEVSDFIIKYLSL